ncbi:hypothetical protein Mapa_005920 [Marchantia paleacea]|nr:hypothetical protein Mapa_005920 [Marchantia paleacea]
MALDSLPARWHSRSVFSSRPFGSLCPGSDGLLDGSRTLLNRRKSESLESPRCARRLVRASIDSGGGLPSGPSLRTERGPNSFTPSPSSFGSHPSSNEQQQSASRVLQRWKSDGAMVMRRALRFEEFGGEESWRRHTTESSSPDVSHDGFERFDTDVVSSSAARETGVFAKIEVGMRFDSHFGIGYADHQDQMPCSVEASAVDVTAPSFVRDRSFAERSHLPSRGLKSSVQSKAGEAASSCRTRPESLQRRMSRSMSLDKAQGKGGLDRPETAVAAAASLSLGPVPQGLGFSPEYVAIPDSLRKLKKRNRNVLATAGETACCSIKKAFDSMVFMIRALQNCAFEMRQVFVSTNDVESILSMVQREMQSSFVWLFQQVFSCTPTLMVSVMILLANFAVFSLGNNVATGAVLEPPTPLVSNLQRRVESEGTLRGVDGKSLFSFVRVDTTSDIANSRSSSAPSTSPDGESTSGRGNFGSGGFGGRSIVVAGGEDGDHFSRFNSRRNAMFSEKVSETKDVQRASVLRPGSGNSVFSTKFEDITDETTSGGGVSIEEGVKAEELGTSEELSYQSLLEQTARELELKAGEPHQHVLLDQETLRRLVAPVTARMESDNYACFDRTDLEYQHAIREEPTNTMLMVNYAQFLFAVRRDNRGAEHFFSKALKLDKEDGDIWARWAIFLWLGRDDRPAADEAYRAAIALDPCNPYHAGSYAHFLWHSDDDEPNAFLMG